ncbi:molybdenum cofactor synthesis domain-containing protein [Halorarius litoreus]|uniref:molybdenum cofactor synthesis domain-containing protein n=1 Tax=Halorarius litoreus TaxID=2962676 RepID=UPI0020CC2E7C|nr:molybdenum cofactor synthesis domain-containing protein [Halorarius litoreus]
MDVVDVPDLDGFAAEEFQKHNLFETDRLFADVYCFEPGQEQTPHTHGDADKVYKVLEGSGTFIVGDEERTLAAGQAVIAPAGERHGVRNDSEGRLRTFVLMARDHHPKSDSGHSHGHDHGHSHDHSGDFDTPHDHSGEAADSTFAVVTISTSRSESDTATPDESGDAIASLAESAGYTVAQRTVVPDDVDDIRAAVTDAIESGVDVVVTTGGTGITPDDVTVEALEPLFDRELPGFGEEFRRRSVAEIGLPGMLSRTTAGVVAGTPVVALPGSENAVRLGVEDLLLPQLDHIIHQVRR